MAIPHDSTLETVWEVGTLANGSRSGADEFVRNVIGKMNSCRLARGSAWVRIGHEGDGKLPNYRTEYEADGGDLKPHKPYRGNGHGDLVRDNSQLQEDTWSTRAMSFTDVKALRTKINSIR